MKEQVVYSDGAVEERILQLLKQGKSEEEIIREADDPAIFHTFSSARTNILNWYPFKKDATVLEVGAGMGAITGALCRMCARVVAIEPSPLRAEVCSVRHRNCANLTVISADVDSYEPDELFDYIVVVGVLEYAAIGSDSTSPYVDMLSALRTKLKPDGVLLLAIENRFGLKYWCGAQEDHTGKPFEGINGYRRGAKAGAYTVAGVATFDRQTLSEFFRRAGFSEWRYYYPMPDYKFTTAVFTDERLPAEEDIRRIKFSYSRDAMLVADERNLYGDLIRNGAFPLFANSFLVEASPKALAQEYIAYATIKRDISQQYNVITRISNQKHVQLLPASEEAKAHIDRIYGNYCELEKRGIPILALTREGQMLSVTFDEAELGTQAYQRALIQGDEAACRRYLDALKAMILQSSEIVNENNAIAEKLGCRGLDMGPVLRHGFIDMTLFNCFVHKEGLVCFDQEWCEENIPLSYILFRSVHRGYMYHATLTERQFLEYIGVNERLSALYEQFETLWLEEHMNRNNLEHFDPLMYHEGITLENRLLWSTGEIERINSELEKVGAWGQRTDQELNKTRRQLELKNEELEQKNEEMERKNRELLRKKEELAQKNEELQSIYHSTSWRLMTHVWKVRDKVIPIGSRRRRVLKLGLKAVRHPVKMIRALNVEKVKKLLEEIRRGHWSEVETQLGQHVGVAGGDVTPPSILVLNADAQETLQQRYPQLSVPRTDEPQVSIIIPVYNQFEYTYLCIKSILLNSGNVPYEIIVADDCSTDLTTQIEQIIVGVRVVRTKKNLRFLRNCNHAAKQARGQYLLFLNNDTQVQPDWLKPLVDLIGRDAGIGMVGSKLIYPDGRLQEAGGILWRDGSAWNYGNGQNPALPEFNYVKEVDYISGASIMIRRELWESIGGFDERFAPAYCEDSDLAFAVRKAGYKVLYQPRSVVVHFEGISNGTSTSGGQKQYQVLNSQKFYKKWKEELAAHPENGQNVFQARDRSYGKTTVVMIDHYVPQFDKDAGSRTIYQYIRLLVDMGYNVKFIGDNFAALQPYTSILEQMGVEVLYGVSYLQNWKEWVAENADKLDIVFMNRPHISEKYIDFFKGNTKAKIIYNLCDLHFLREQREYEVTGDKSLEESAKQWKQRELGIIRKADRVFSLSVDEKKILDQYVPGEKTVICPIFIYDDFVEKLPERVNTKDLLFVGGFSHHPNADAVLWFCSAVFPKIRQAIPGIRLHIVGSNVPDSIQRLQSDSILIEGFVPDEKLEELYRRCRVCVIPLRYGAGVKGKTIEAMHNGIPIVTTSIGIEGLPSIEACITPHDDADGFAEEVIRTYCEENGSCSQKCYEYVRAHYSLAAAKAFFAREFVKGE